jgi:hypothetical protein
MIDASPGLHLNDFHDSEDDESTISNTEAFYEEQDEKENVVVRSIIKLFSPTEEALQAWKHHKHHTVGTFAGQHACGLQSRLTNISCQLPHLLVPYTATNTN